MLLPVRIISYGAITLICGFAAVIAWKIASGEISLDGLLDTAGSHGTRVFSAARLQLLMATVIVAAEYLSAVWHNPHRDALPPIPLGFLALHGLSSSVYLLGKALDQYVPLARKRQ